MLILLSTVVGPRITLHPGPVYVAEGNNVTLPSCHVTGYPTPEVTWTRSLGQLPQWRVQTYNTAMKIFNFTLADSDNYLCTARNVLGKVLQGTQLVVVSPPKFIVTPPKIASTIPG